MPTSFGDPSLVTNSFSQPHSSLGTDSDQVELQSLPQPPRWNQNTTLPEPLLPHSLIEETDETSQLSPKHRPSDISFGEASTSTHHSSGPSSPTDSEFRDFQMGRRKQSPRTETSSTPSSTASGGLDEKRNGSMDSHLEMRRKHLSVESPDTASQTAHLISRENFSLDDEPPPTPITPNVNTSFFDLPRQDRRNFLLLVLLYFLQGIPMGLASGSVPFLLKSHLSYAQIGVFSLASYPYSLKLLWSPIVDAVWSPALGRRKSWIMPIQLCSGFGMLYLGSRIKDMMVAAGASDGSGVWTFTWWWFFLVFLCATQDIAVDGEKAFIILPSSIWSS